MNSFRTFTLATVVVAAAGEAMQYGAPIMARNDCPALPELCTGPAMVHGSAMTLTYLCPTSDAGPSVSTVHVTVTATTTVTAAPNNNPAAPPKISPAPAEPTSTTTVHSTMTQYKTLTVTRKKSTESPTPTLMPTTTSTVPSTPSSSSSSSQVVTDAFTLLPPFSPAPVSSTSKDISMPCMTCSSNWLMPIASAANNTTSGESTTQTVSATGTISAGPTSRNASSMPGYSFPTLHIVRDIESVKPSKTGGAGVKNVSLAALLMGLVLGMCLV